MQEFDIQLDKGFVLSVYDIFANKQEVKKEVKYMIKSMCIDVYKYIVHVSFILNSSELNYVSLIKYMIKLMCIYVYKCIVHVSFILNSSELNYVSFINKTTTMYQ